MTVESVDTLIVGGGQAGIAMSEHSGARGIEHLVLERDRIAENWRSKRRDSLVANGPVWHDRFLGMEFLSSDPDDFVGKDAVVEYLLCYAERIGAPIRSGVEVASVARNPGKPGFSIKTSAGAFEANRIVATTGPFQTPVIPPAGNEAPSLMQIHSSEYRNPDQLPKIAVLVVASGSSGTQIAEDLMRSGRKVYLSVGPHDRPPRIYRQRDYCWWLGVLGKWDAAATNPDTEHVTISVSGVDGGRTVDFRNLADEGMMLVGMTRSFKDGVARFAPDLVDNIAKGDQNYLSLPREQTTKWIGTA